MMVRARTSRSVAGLTLLEMMIALTIVATAVVILIPTVVETVDTARRVQCTNNLGLITRALRWYHDDRGTFPLNYSYYGILWIDDVAVAAGPRWALGGLSPYVGGPLGGPGGEGDLRGLDETEFAPAYICPAADLEAVYAAHLYDKYHACYWTNIAVRVNRGWQILFHDWPPGTGYPPGDDTNSGGQARYFGHVCPNVGRHWRSVYHPRMDTIRNPAGMVFIGDTRNTPYSGWSSTGPGDYQMKPGWGYVSGYLGFDRHQGRMMLGYVDGHARAFAEEELEEYSYFTFGEPTGDFTLNYSGNDGCGGTLIHTLPDRVGERE